MTAYTEFKAALEQLQDDLRRDEKAIFRRASKTALGHDAESLLRLENVKTRKVVASKLSTPEGRRYFPPETHEEVVSTLIKSWSKSKFNRAGDAPVPPSYADQHLKRRLDRAELLDPVAKADRSEKGRIEQCISFTYFLDMGLVLSRSPQSLPNFAGRTDQMIDVLRLYVMAHRETVEEMSQALSRAAGGAEGDGEDGDDNVVSLF